jgi:hypothetical protein
VTTGAGWGMEGAGGAGVADTGGDEGAAVDGEGELLTAGDRRILRIVVVRRMIRLVTIGRLA